MVYDRRFLRSLVIHDQADRPAHSGDPRLPEWCVSYDIYSERQPDLLVPAGLDHARELKPAWSERYEAWQRRDVEECRSCQKELMRRRHRHFGDARLCPRTPVRPAGQAELLPA